jgi:hypothetical protein
VSDLGTDPNIYEDITVPVGCSLEWGFQLEPWDATGALAATFTVFPSGASMPSSYDMVVTVTTEADDALTQYYISLTAAQLALINMDVQGMTALYNVRWTDTLGGVWALGYGMILVPQ